MIVRETKKERRERKARKNELLQCQSFADIGIVVFVAAVFVAVFIVQRTVKG